MEDLRYKNIMETVEAYKNLMNSCLDVSVKKALFKDDDIDYLIAILRNTPGFNEKDNKKIANNIKDFWLKLPRRYYNENNPNNGRPFFDAIRFESDTTILFEGYGTLTDEEIKDIKKLIEDFAKLVLADERSLYIDPSPYVKEYASYTIRFWWD